MSAPDDIAFRPLTHDDLPMFHAWQHAEHARPWFGHSLDEIVEEYGPAIDGEVPLAAYVATLGGRPVGVFNWERFGDAPEFAAAYGVTDPDAANCDVILGDPAVAHRGLGPVMIRAFLERVVFADPRVTEMVIDPVVDNAIAIRAYEKAGFRFWRAIADDGDGNALYLMVLRRDELHAPRESPPFTIRPARVGEVELAARIDDDACTRYVDAGLVFDTSRHPAFFAREVAAWSRSAAEGRMLFACAPDGEPVGFASLGFVDGEPLLHQLSVRRAWMGRGIGRALVARAQRWSVRHGALWLTTYDHLPWNAPFYARQGFSMVAEDACGPELRGVLADERRALPAATHRVAMRFQHAGVVDSTRRADLVRGPTP